MKSHIADPDQREGEGSAAGSNDRRLRAFVAAGRIDPPARGAVPPHRSGPHDRRVSVDELVAKGRSLADRVRPLFDRAMSRLRARQGRR